MISVENLTKEFDSGEGTVKVLKKVTFEVPEASFVAILGKSGSGKSTLLSLLGSLDRPTSGTIEVDGKAVSQLSDRQSIAYRRNSLGFIFQNYQLIPNLTALENVMLPMEFAGKPKREQKNRAEKLLKEVGLTSEKHNRFPGKLSGGEQQRVAIARALANHPKIILADEPTGNLDSQTGAMIIELLRNLTKTSQTTIIVVTHDQGITKHADKVIHIQDGRIAA